MSDVKSGETKKKNVMPVILIVEFARGIGGICIDALQTAFSELKSELDRMNTEDPDTEIALSVMSLCGFPYWMHNFVRPDEWDVGGVREKMNGGTDVANAFSLLERELHRFSFEAHGIDFENMLSPSIVLFSYHAHSSDPKSVEHRLEILKKNNIFRKAKKHVMLWNGQADSEEMRTVFREFTGAPQCVFSIEGPYELAIAYKELVICSVLNGRFPLKCEMDWDNEMIEVNTKISKDLISRLDLEDIESYDFERSVIQCACVFRWI